jgi:hypothetical protein
MKTIQYFLNLVYYATWCANERQDKVLYNIMHFILKPFINSSMKDKKEFLKGVNDVRNTHSSMFYSLVGNMVFTYIMLFYAIVVAIPYFVFNITYSRDNQTNIWIGFWIVGLLSGLTYYFAIRKDDVFLKYFKHFEGKVTRSQKILALVVFYIGIPLLGIVLYLFYYLSD